MNKGKGRRHTKHKLKHTYDIQFERTVANTGKWRGKKIN